MTMTNTNVTDQGPRLSVSTWSLHRQLGGPKNWGNAPRQTVYA